MELPEAAPDGQTYLTTRQAAMLAQVADCTITSWRKKGLLAPIAGSPPRKPFYRMDDVLDAERQAWKNALKASGNDKQIKRRHRGVALASTFSPSAGTSARLPMRFTRGRYPDWPGAKHTAPCWRIGARRFHLDADGNTRFPFGVGVYGGSGPFASLPSRAGFYLDVNAPMGEPNRFSVWAAGWQVTFGLVSWRTFRATSREAAGPRGIPVIHGDYVRCRPHLEGLDRYRYHQDEAGKWVRNDRPERWHWGWLTIERRSGKERVNAGASGP